MTEQAQAHPEMQNTVFGEVLTEMLEARDLPVTPFKVGKLAEDAGLDGWAVINRMASTEADHPGGMSPLAEALDFSEQERLELAWAFSYDERYPEMPY